MTQTAINYGKILYDLNIPREQIQILDELLSEEPKIVAYLSNPTIEQPEKSAVVNRILDGELAAFVNMLCKYHRTKSLPDAIHAYYKYYDKQKGIVRCTLKYTKPVKQEEKEKMKAVLMAKFHAKEIIMEEHQDSSILGGLLIEADGIEYDFSYEGRLRQLEKKLIGR